MLNSPGYKNDECLRDQFDPVDLFLAARLGFSIRPDLGRVNNVTVQLRLIFGLVLIDGSDQKLEEIDAILFLDHVFTRLRVSFLVKLFDKNQTSYFSGFAILSSYKALKKL